MEFCNKKQWEVEEVKILKKGKREKQLRSIPWEGMNGSKKATLHCKCEAVLELRKGDWLLQEDGSADCDEKIFAAECPCCHRRIRLKKELIEKSLIHT